MNKRIVNFELNGKFVLGFDTGLDARSFAQTKMSLFITQPGYIVHPDGKIETWQPEGVTEFALTSVGQPDAALPDAKTMIIWGLPIPGEELAEVLNRKDEALDALRCWLRARIVLEKHTEGGQECSFPGPAGALIITAASEYQYPPGTVFFPPARLLKRTLDASGTLLDAERYVHPDLKGQEGISFCAGAMLYRIFCGAPPFLQNTENELRQDIREGVFAPPHLAAPGLDPQLSALITGAIGPVSSVSREAKPRPAPETISGFIGPPLSKQTSSWIKNLGEKEVSDIRAEHELYGKRKARAVKGRRFVARNTTIICVSVIALIVFLFTVRSIARSRSELPTTRGMTVLEVAEAYYNAFNDLDHTTMQACVTGRAGREDIQTVTSLFVVSRVRQAYETGQTFMPASDWLEAGRPVTDMTVFGITDIVINVLSEDGETAILEAHYTLWMQSASETEMNTIALPVGLDTRDILSLAYQRDGWRITGIERNGKSL